jgi:pimeloyl-ACP methyl ester carboxylesterase
VLVLVHGLAMNDLQWTRHGHDHGQALAQAAGWTPVYLHYNSGLHVAENGRLLSQRLTELLAAWPVPVTELAIVGHSMGGLVARSACHVGARRRWRRQLTRLVCLGTPHHGAPLERGGHMFDLLLEAMPYAAPLARLGQRRSAGIIDLRHGSVQDADRRPGERRPTPLPRGVDCYVVAATLAAMVDRPERLHRRLVHGLHERLIGDGLVPLASALGEHPQPALALKLPASHRLIVPSASHWDLLDHPQVSAALKRWLA